MMRCSKECGRQWRLKQGKLGWQKQKEEGEEKEKIKEEKKKKKKRTKTINIKKVCKE